MQKWKKLNNLKNKQVKLLYIMNLDNHISLNKKILLNKLLLNIKMHSNKLVMSIKLELMIGLKMVYLIKLLILMLGNLYLYIIYRSLTDLYGDKEDNF